MKVKEILSKAAVFFLILTVICGAIYTLAITGISQLIFPDKANGSIIEIDGKKYGSELLAQQYIDDSHLWGRIMKIDTQTLVGKDGKAVMYSAPSNLTPTSEEYEKLVTERVSMIRAAHPDKGETAIPVDLVTGSGSGLDPHISVAAAKYQVGRIAENTDYSEADVTKIIDKYTQKRFLGVFGEETVNVLQVNLALDKILK